jgi:hypothetical protein
MESLPLDVEGPSDARCTIATENAGATRRPIRFGVPDPVGLPLPPVLLTGQRGQRMEQGRVGPSVAPEFPLVVEIGPKGGRRHNSPLSSLSACYHEGCYFYLR